MKHVHANQISFFLKYNFNSPTTSLNQRQSGHIKNCRSGKMKTKLLLESLAFKTTKQINLINLRFRENGNFNGQTCILIKQKTSH